jgi:hypothetical protein
MKENSQIVFQTINNQVESSVHTPASNPVDKDNELRLKYDYIFISL